jgi:hypothetical protein
MHGLSTLYIHQLNMTVPAWQPGTQYNYGDIVEYDGNPSRPR